MNLKVLYRNVFEKTHNMNKNGKGPLISQEQTPIKIWILVVPQTRERERERKKYQRN